MRRLDGYSPIREAAPGLDEPSKKVPQDPKQRSQPAPPTALAKLTSVAAITTEADVHGFVPWGAYNLVAGVDAEATLAGVAIPTELTAGLNGATVSVAGADVLATGLNFGVAAGTCHQEARRFKEAKAKRWQGGTGAWDYNNAKAAHDQAKGNVARTTPGVVRDVLGGSVGEASRLKVAADGASLYGANAGIGPDVTFGAISCTTYLVTGIAQSVKVDKSVDRTFRVKDAARRAATGRELGGACASQSMQNLDTLFRDGNISQNVYDCLRTRPDADVEHFVANWLALGVEGKERLEKLLHFSGGHKFVTAFNMSRTTNLNTASARRAAREAVIDAFVRPGAGADQAKLFDDLKTARKEALGAKAAADVVVTERTLRAYGVDPDELGANVVQAIARSGRSDEFCSKYAGLAQWKRAELREILHFGSWRFWKSDATLPTTKYQRSDIRVALVKRFADDMPLDRLRVLKVRYNQKILPLRTINAQSAPPVDNMMIEHILAFQDGKLDALKEEKRDAKIKIAYGLANGVAAIAETAVNPAATSGVSATRAILSAPYLVYAARRGLGNLLNQRNSMPVTAAMREEAFLLVLPDEKARIDYYLRRSEDDSERFIRDLKDPVEFLKTELGLTSNEANKVLRLEKAGKGSAARAFLIRKKPEANILIALRRTAEERGVDGYFRDPKIVDTNYKAWKASVLDTAMRPSAQIEHIERQRIMSGSPRMSPALREAEVRRVASMRRRQLAQDNPVLATRLFVDELLSSDRGVAAGARNMLREFRFSEGEILALRSLGVKGGRRKVADMLQDHLLGENLRRRFSTRKLSKKGRHDAALALTKVKVRPVPHTDPLAWRLAFEQAGVNVIDNVGAPGLDSILNALQQHFVGKTDCASSSMRRSVMQARKRVLGELHEVARQGIDANVMAHIDRIVQIAAEEFGKPGAKAMIAETSMAGQVRCAGAPRDGKTPDAVLCYDNLTRRAFVLDAVDEKELQSAQQKD
jgi:hypothetical protein